MKIESSNNHCESEENERQGVDAAENTHVFFYVNR
jgi:hypothetical protein